jgi:hypothetical protein
LIPNGFALGRYFKILGGPPQQQRSRSLTFAKTKSIKLAPIRIGSGSGWCVEGEMVRRNLSVAPGMKIQKKNR